MTEPTQMNIVDLKANLRAATLGKGKQFRTETIEIEGQTFELRQPTIRERKDLRKKCTKVAEGKFEFDMFEFLIWAMINHTYVPGTNERVFSEEDYDAITSQPSGGWVDDLSGKAAELCYLEVDEESKKKSSEMIESGNLSIS